MSLRRNFAWTAAGNVIYAVCLWGVMIVLTKLGTTADVGRFAVVTALVNPIFMLGNLQLRMVYVTDSRAEHDFGDYFGLRLLLLPLSWAAAVAVAVAGYSGPQVLAVAVLAAGRGVEGVSDMLYAFAQKRDRMDVVARATILKGVLSLLGCAAAFGLTRDLAWGLAGMVAGWALPLLVYEAPVCRRLARAGGAERLRPAWKGSVLRRIAVVAAPLGVTMMLLQLRNTIPRTALESSFGEETVGVFAALTYFVIAGTTVVTALTQSSVARLARMHAAGRTRDFTRLLARLAGVGMLIGAAGVAVAWLAGGRLLELVYTREYAAHSRLFVAVMAAGGVMYVSNLLGAPVTAMRMFRAQVVMFAGAIAVMAAAAWLLIPAHGLGGAVATMAVGAVAMILGNLVLVAVGLRRGAPAADNGRTAG